MHLPFLGLRCNRQLPTVTHFRFDRSMTNPSLLYGGQGDPHACALPLYHTRQHAQDRSAINAGGYTRLRLKISVLPILIRVVSHTHTRRIPRTECLDLHHGRTPRVPGGAPHLRDARLHCSCRLRMQVQGHLATVVLLRPSHACFPGARRISPPSITPPFHPCPSLL